MKIIKLTIFLSVLVRFGFAQIAPKYIKDVYENIFRSMSTGAIIKPKLILVDDLKLPPNERVIASYSPHDKTIKVGQSFIELTRRFGADSSNARAHILSHELAHLFLNHGYAKIIGTGFASSLINKEIKKSREKIEEQLGESAADQCAFFYAYISGYSTNEIAPKLLDSIYINYQLTDKMLSEYPPLKERKNYAKQASVKMHTMNETFDFANICLAHGDYEMAEAIYKTIIDEGFKSREIISNLGATYLIHAIKLMDTTSFKYVLPIQLDFNSRLSQNDTRALIDNDEINGLLLEAYNNFLISITIDPNYSIGYFNLSITCWLLNKEEDADFYLKKCSNLNEDNMGNKIQLYSSIRNIMSKNQNLILKGESGLEELSKSNYTLAKLNWDIHKGKITPISNQTKLNDYISKLGKKKLTGDFMNSTNILDSTFKRDSYKVLSCKEIKSTYTARRWKYSQGNKQPLVIQYTFDDQLNLKEFKDENDLYTNAKYIFETNTKKIFIFGDIIIIEQNGKQSYQILKSNP